MTEKQSKLRVAFGKRVRKMRRELDISQEELAERVGTSRSHISSLERGQFGASMELAERIAKAFKVKLEDLVRGL